MLIDAHVHLDKYGDRLDDALKEIETEQIFTVATAMDVPSYLELQKIAERSNLVLPTFGIHPRRAAEYADRLHEIGRHIETSPAIGEIGLDYHYDFSPRDIQHAVFRVQIQLALSRDLPIVIHTREAEDDTLRLITEEGADRLRGVFHCFTGDSEAAARALVTGFLLSIPGVATFPKADALRQAAAGAPADRLLVETDSPYLAPVPFRGKRNEPAYVAKVVEQLAAVRGVSAAAIGEETDRNFDRLFRP